MDISDELATQLLNAAPDPTVIVDRQGVIIYANARVTEVLGYSSQELIGQAVEVLLPERARDGHPGHRESFFSRPNARAMGDADTITPDVATILSTLLSDKNADVREAATVTLRKHDLLGEKREQ